MRVRSTIVTGAGAGLGAAFAKAIAADGSSVLVNNRRHQDRPYPAEEVSSAIRADGGTAATDEHAVDLDGGPEAIVDAALQRFGGLDALVLNAGISGPAIKVGDGDTELRQVLEINFFANARLIEAALPHLRRSSSARIVVISSTGGLHGVRGRSAYAASKGAVTAYALSLADELRRDAIHVNVLAPYAHTKMTDRPGRAPDPRMAPEGAAAICAWLAGEACDRTGEIWVAGGGHVRAAKAMESRAAPFGPARLDALAAMPAPRGFDGGEAAFADFYQDAFGED
ncbi:SDR family NAD(P)-dependent oxidoreductase [Qipengyuania spongiae]|uniref:SDR family NAD(P)-dependent oxidoreductase n=1 Tax=Qipengyuania spongiae TaxID=2909673 RepID=A0ABY5SY23_9SPHN|nr:SDR family NAD(P)-dependent oxidoreductase [Qipengyuania spongiae]UVI39448.1 SDR family NAD(P)-dependent oxidoreductase [Qipengyuania spongiae]